MAALRGATGPLVGVGARLRARHVERPLRLDLAGEREGLREVTTGVEEDNLGIRSKLCTMSKSATSSKEQAMATSSSNRSKVH
jgi:hypothetical protein